MNEGIKNKDLFLKRMSRLRQDLEKNGFGACLLAYSRDIFYHTGTAQPAFLAVSPDDCALFVKSGMDFVLNETFLDPSMIVEERKLSGVYNAFFSGLKNKKIGLELDVLTALEFMELQAIFKGARFENISPLILARRAVKDPFEVAQTRRGGLATLRGYEAARAALRPGVTELALSAAVEHAHRLAGHEGSFFFRMRDFFMSAGPVGAGEALKRNSGVLYSLTGTGQSASVPAGPSGRPIREGENVIIDIPCHINGYHVDHTRSFVAGKASPDARACYDDLKEISDFLISEVIRPGAACADIYGAAVDRAKKLGRDKAFLRFGNGKRSVLAGHGVGLEVNEPPIILSKSREKIVENHILAVELHMMDDKAGVLKIEDTIHVGAGGNEILTVSPRGLFESG
ncbi:Xaa-Pro aminopeptidase [Candidatus Desulfarcum epimagneticum]|uniref:Xaa-Pro aminopeptidase n=1 Tax=uncultured Desulfobacteraceae bacterium TaxID=218296 RepID=A0A484HH45_9BACT|nr:Xaa-Pro aminopeptidase [uncultured Desulfobacteraceae bacterium]